MFSQMGTGNLAARHGEENSMFSGTKSAAAANSSLVEKLTIKAYKDIKKAAKNNNTTPEDIALKHCLKRLDNLKYYVASKGETTANTNVGVVVQACLLRMQDIAIVSSAGNLSEDEALKEIQEAESQAIEFSTDDKDNVIAPETQAALNCLIVILLQKMEAATGRGDIQGALNLIKIDSPTPLNNAIGDSGLPALTPLDLSLTPAVTAGTNGDSSSSFWDILNKIAATANTVAGAVKNVANSTSGAILTVGNAVQTTGANTGASAISLYMQRNGLTILIIGLLAIVLLIILVRATRNK
jgi:hypothetical protein